jgi:hypothetical protein
VERGDRNRVAFEKKNRAIFFFSLDFYTILHFNEFCRMRYFEFFNLVLIQNLEIHSSFFRIFYFKIFTNFKINRQVFIDKMGPTGFIGFQ